MLILLFTTYISFCEVQSPGFQHILIISTSFFLIILLLFDRFTKKDRQKRLNIIISVLILFDFVICSGRLNYLLPPDTPGLAEYTHTPLVRNDLEKVGEIVQDINSLTVEKNDTYVAVGEYLFNSDTLHNYGLPYTVDSVPSLSPVSDVDLRDGFPREFLSASYVFSCTSDNCTYNNHEKILEYINGQIVDNSSAIGKHYELVSAYDIDNDLNIELYKKVSQYSKDDLEVIAQYFDEVYPDHEELFRNRITGD